MDATSRRPQLPALSYLDIDKAKEEMYQSRHSSAAQNHSAALPSPSHQYPSGPPPPYSHPPPLHANNWSGAKSPLPGSRRASGEEHDGVKQKQSLPSLSEALGVESQTSYSQPPPTSQPLPLSTHQSQPAAPTSPSPIRKRSYGMDSSETHNPYQYSFFRQDSAAPQSQQAVETKHTYPPIQESRPPLHLQTAHPSRDYRPEKIGQSQTSSPQFERSTAQSTSSMGPPSFPYGYTPYPPRYAQPSPASSNAGPIYQPSSQYPAPQTPSSNWKSENSSSSRFGPDDRHTTPPAYGDSVKRHLDLYDLEVALTEIANNSNIMLDFSRRYGDRMHQSARSGPSISTLPSIVEVEDMIAKSRIQLDCLNKIREVVYAQQAAYDQQLADQRQQRKTFHEPPPPQPVEHEVDEAEGKGGFAGPDAKKRRGRAAPPGRCHSCNRAETPEWRRGPDGARTLCNACGLHYAKLTRKQASGSKAANVGTSNLRPKEA